ncbi:MAG: dicarboxylate/amino acid:cation symporter [Simkaniaceae bacterium]|nr:dicarboxylate/amino acid:cation symporter [Simkaniaceae bacterium]
MKPWFKVLLGIVSGIAVGLILNRPVTFLSLTGKAFINLLKMLVGLIVFSSLVTGMCHINDPKKLGKIGITTLLFYVCSTLCAIGIGLVTVYAIRPGQGLALEVQATHATSKTLNLTDFLFSIVPSNPFVAFVRGDILQVIIFAALFAIAMILIKEKALPVLHVVESLGEVMARLTHLVMALAPYGVFALMATTVGSVGLKVIMPLLRAILCIFLACMLQVVVIFFASLRILTKVRITPFFKGMKDAIIVAFTTSSSSATLPVSLECSQKHLGISPDIAGFTLSLGSTVNMNGTAIGQAILSLFIAQAYAIPVTPFMLVILIFTTLLSAIGTAGVPGSGLVMLSIVLNAMGLPLEGIALVAGIDRFRDMFGTVVNILGDAVAALYVAKKEGAVDSEKYDAATWVD